MKPYHTYIEDNPAILRTEPDIIIRQPITAQLSVNSYTTPMSWSYVPCGSVPVDRLGVQVTEGNLTPQNKSRHFSEYNNTITVSQQSGSRYWCKDLFDSFKEVHKSKQKFWALINLCGECMRVPCMMYNIANSLGDKGYLPFIPGTGAAIRFKVRVLGGIHGTIANDCLVTSCCCPCATCQMHREIEDIGLRPTW